MFNGKISDLRDLIQDSKGPRFKNQDPKKTTIIPAMKALFHVEH
jgi:hypothetical protein